MMKTSEVFVTCPVRWNTRLVGPLFLRPDPIFAALSLKNALPKCDGGVLNCTLGDQKCADGVLISNFADIFCKDAPLNRKF
jgi:hypothetical protein